MKKILVHTCCGPCSIMPLEILLKNDFSPTTYFFNPNIHFQDEFLLRLFAMKEVAMHYDIPLIIADHYDYFEQIKQESSQTINEQRMQYKKAIIECTHFLYSHMHEEKLKKSIQKVLKKWKNYKKDFSTFTADALLTESLAENMVDGVAKNVTKNIAKSVAGMPQENTENLLLTQKYTTEKTDLSTCLQALNQTKLSTLPFPIVSSIFSSIMNEDNIASNKHIIIKNEQNTAGFKIDIIPWVARLQEYKEGERCKMCYQERLYQTALYAAQNGFHSFTSTLLYSRYQNHDDICFAAKKAMERVNKEIEENMIQTLKTDAELDNKPDMKSDMKPDMKSVSFYYEDFREYWQKGIDASKDLGLYRQKWCGCALSRIESLERMSKREYEKVE